MHAAHPPSASNRFGSRSRTVDAGQTVTILVFYTKFRFRRENKNVLRCVSTTEQRDGTIFHIKQKGNRNIPHTLLALSFS